MELLIDCWSEGLFCADFVPMGRTEVLRDTDTGHTCSKLDSKLMREGRSHPLF